MSPDNAYITPRRLAEALGVGRSTVQRWVDAGSIAADRTAGGHRRIPLHEAVRFIRSSRLTLRDPAALGLADLHTRRRATDPPAPADDQLMRLLIDGDAAAFRGQLLLRFLHGESAASLFDDHLALAMHTIGRMHPDDPRGILVEHRATEICVEAINQIRMLMPPRASTRPRAVGCAYPNDSFTLPSLMAATVVAAEGWSELNLGCNTPLDSLALAVEETEARLAWLSASVIDHGERFAADVAALADRLSESNVILAVGGRAVPEGWRPRADNIRKMRTMRELEALAHGIAAGSSPRQVRTD